MATMKLAHTLRKQLVTFLILLMTAFPVWSASRLCHHVQTSPVSAETHAADHHCCLDQQASSPQAAGDTCHCDQLQHAQFILSVPVVLAMTPAKRFIPPLLLSRLLPERADILYRPPIA